MAGLSSFVLGAGASALQQEHAAAIRQRQLAQQAEAERRALEARYAHERWLAERELQAQRDAVAREQQAEREAAARERAFLDTQQGSEMANLQASHQVAARGTDTDVRNRLAQLQQTQAAEEQRRVEALRRAMAKHRASFGARGVTAAGGSGEAILLGLVGESDRERQTAIAADRLQTQALQQRVSDLNRRNLLEQSQLAERHRIQRLSRLV